MLQLHALAEYPHRRVCDPGGGTVLVDLEEFEGRGVEGIGVHSLGEGCRNVDGTLYTLRSLDGVDDIDLRRDGVSYVDSEYRIPGGSQGGLVALPLTGGTSKGVPLKNAHSPRVIVTKADFLDVHRGTENAPQ